MNGIMILLLYIVCFFIGFCGGLVGCLYYKKLEKAKNRKTEYETMIEDC